MSTLTQDQAVSCLEDLQLIAADRDKLWATLLRMPDVDGNADDPVVYLLRSEIKRLDRQANRLAADLEAWRAS